MKSTIFCVEIQPTDNGSLIRPRDLREGKFCGGRIVQECGSWESAIEAAKALVKTQTLRNVIDRDLTYGHVAYATERTAATGSASCPLVRFEMFRTNPGPKKFQAIIESMTSEGIRPWKTCDHLHKTEEAASRCSYRLWHQTFGSRYTESRHNYRPNTWSIA